MYKGECAEMGRGQHLQYMYMYVHTSELEQCTVSKSDGNTVL